MSLFQHLTDAYLAETNYEDKNFISFKKAREIVTKDRIDDWSKSHPLCPEHEDQCPQKREIMDKILKSNILVFVVLVFAKLEFLIKKLITSGSKDLMLFDNSRFERICGYAQLSADQKQKLVQFRGYVGVMFGAFGTQDVPSDAVLPFLKRESLGKYGSYGVLYRVTIAGQHLRDYPDTVRSTFLNFRGRICSSF